MQSWISLFTQCVPPKAAVRISTAVWRRRVLSAHQQNTNTYKTMENLFFFSDSSDLHPRSGERVPGRAAQFQISTMRIFLVISALLSCASSPSAAASVVATTVDSTSKGSVGADAGNIIDGTTKNRWTSFGICRGGNYRGSDTSNLLYGACAAGRCTSSGTLGGCTCESIDSKGDPTCEPADDLKDATDASVYTGVHIILHKGTGVKGNSSVVAAEAHCSHYFWVGLSAPSTLTEVYIRATVPVETILIAHTLLDGKSFVVSYRLCLPTPTPAFMCDKRTAVQSSLFHCAVLFIVANSKYYYFALRRATPLTGHNRCCCRNHPPGRTGGSHRDP